MVIANVMAASGRTGTSLLVSPAVVAPDHVPGARQLLFAGEVLGADGQPLDRAVLTVWGVQLQVEALGRFELLAYGPPTGETLISVTVAAPGHTTVEAHVIVDDTGSRLTDGTVVLLHTFVLEGGVTR